MAPIANATPIIEFAYSLDDELNNYGYTARINSLYQYRPTSEPWTLGLLISPQRHSGQSADLQVEMEETSEDGCVGWIRLEKLLLCPVDDPEAHQALDEQIENSSNDGSQPISYGILSRIVADVLDSFGVAAGDKG